MANQGSDVEVNAEGSEKEDQKSTTKSDLKHYDLQDNNAKVAGLAAGYRDSKLNPPHIQ